VVEEDTAKPSLSDRSNGGTFIGEYRSMARTRPLDSNRPTYSTLFAFIFGRLNEENNMTKAFSTEVKFLEVFLDLGLPAIYAESPKYLPISFCFT
jgi:hypothetical protein